MKIGFSMALMAIIAGTLPSCSTSEPHRREVQREEHDAKWDAERRARDRQRDADDYRFFLEDYAHRLGKSVPELSKADLATARREFEAEGGRHYEDYNKPNYWR